MTEIIYCDECLVTMSPSELDDRFDYEVCYECVDNLGLDPNDSDEPSDDFPMYLEYDEGGY
jgi:hypothetical protein